MLQPRADGRVVAVPAVTFAADGTTREHDGRGAPASAAAPVRLVAVLRRGPRRARWCCRRLRASPRAPRAVATCRGRRRARPGPGAAGPRLVGRRAAGRAGRDRRRLGTWCWCLVARGCGRGGRPCWSGGRRAAARGRAAPGARRRGVRGAGRRAARRAAAGRRPGALRRGVARARAGRGGARRLGADVPAALRRLARRPGPRGCGRSPRPGRCRSGPAPGSPPRSPRSPRTARARQATRHLVHGELASAQATARLVAVLPVGVAGDVGRHRRRPVALPARHPGRARLPGARGSASPSPGCCGSTGSPPAVLRGD